MISDIKIDTSAYGPLNKNYSNQIRKTIRNALHEHPRTMLLRIDLHLPNKYITTDLSDSTLMTRFIKSLEAQVKSREIRRRKEGKRVYPCKIRYVWAREFCQDGQKHYHFVLTFNKDEYAYPGPYKPVDGKYSHNLALMIMESWVRALGFLRAPNYRKYYTLVTFPENCYHYINRNWPEPEYIKSCEDALFRALYLAKEYSKHYSSHERSFGCSQY